MFGIDTLIYIVIFLSVVSAVLSMVLRPKAMPPMPAAAGDFQVPTAEEGRFVPVVFGEIVMRAPNIVWYGDLFLVPINSSTGGKK